MNARFEVVRTDAGWHARFRAANSRVVWVTENYTRKVGAEDAIAILVRVDAILIPVLDVDERTP